jgi:UDP-galactopyranose mutase
MNTFYQLWGVRSPTAAKEIINNQIEEAKIGTPRNLEEQALSMVGSDIYKVLIKSYTEKQWGRNARELPAFIIKRLPLRFTFDNNYFNDRYQGIPIGGYNKLIDGLLEGTEVFLNVDYFDQKQIWEQCAEKIVFTGKIDEFYSYKEGILDYRSLRFEHQRLQLDNYQGNAVVNYTDAETPYTRIIEHKHFEFGTQDFTVITKEYPEEGSKDNEPYYPINDPVNQKIYNRYKAISSENKNVIFGGRLGEYKYYDMHQVIASALKTVQLEETTTL